MASETITYTYDSRGRLTKVTHSGTVNNGVSTSYTYDKADNRTNRATSGVGAAAAARAALRRAHTVPARRAAESER
jgi:hypothetical protein